MHDIAYLTQCLKQTIDVSWMLLNLCLLACWGRMCSRMLLTAVVQTLLLEHHGFQRKFLRRRRKTIEPSWLMSFRKTVGAFSPSCHIINFQAHHESFECYCMLTCLAYVSFCMSKANNAAHRLLTEGQALQAELAGCPEVWPGYVYIDWQLCIDDAIINRTDQTICVWLWGARSTNKPWEKIWIPVWTNFVKQRMLRSPLWPTSPISHNPWLLLGEKKTHQMIF